MQRSIVIILHLPFIFTSLFICSPVQAARVESAILSSAGEAFNPASGNYRSCADSPQHAYEHVQETLKKNCIDPHFRSIFRAASEQDCLDLPVSLSVCGSNGSADLNDFIKTSQAISNFIENGNMPALSAESAATTVMIDLQTRESRIVNASIDDEMRSFKEKLKLEAQPRIDAAVLDLANVRDAQREMQLLKSHYDTEFSDLIASYQVIAAKAKEYIGFRTNLVSQLKGLASQANFAELDSIPQISVKLTELISQNDHFAIFALFELEALDRQILAFRGDFETRSNELIAAMKQPSMPHLNGTKPLLDGIATMTANYTRSRVVFNRGATELQQHLIHRQDGLIKRHVDEQIKSAREASMQLSSSGAFLSSNSKLVVAAWKTLPQVNGYPLLGEQFQSMNDLISRESLCAYSSIPGKEWMKTGCNFLLPEIYKVRNYQANTLPAILQSYIDLFSLTASAKTRDLLVLASTKLAGGDIAYAIRLYDTAAVMAGVAP